MILDPVQRRGALEGLPPFPATTRAKLVGAGPLTRFVFRGSPAAAAQMSRAFGPELSTRPMAGNEAGGRAALWLGPDEWLLIARDGEEFGIRNVVGTMVTEPMALVDVSHRNTGLVLTGTRAADVVAAGCPLDLDPAVFKPGMVTRTLLGRAEVVLWRQAVERFHIECWRSFAPYMQAFLAEAAREYQAG